MLFFVPLLILGIALGALGTWLWARRELNRLAAERVSIQREAASAELTLTRMRQAIASATDAIGLGDMEGNSIYHNPAHMALFGYTVAELNAIEFQGVLFADPGVARSIHASIWAGQSWTGETDVLTRDGRRVPCLVRCDAIRDEAGVSVGIFGVFTDMTERRRMQQQADEYRQRLELTLQSISDAVITTDADGTILLMNPVAEMFLGLTASEAVGRPMAEVLRLVDEVTREPRPSALAEGLRSGASGAAEPRWLLDPHGAERLVLENVALIRSPAGQAAGAVLVIRDITRERQRSEEAARASRLEALGLLAGGIAHDFGNLLQAMIGNVTLAQLVPGLPEKAVARLAAVEKTIWRARDVTRQLKTYAKGGEVEKKRVALPRLLREATDYAVAANSSVTAEYHLAPALAEVEADEGQLIQVFNNLAVNAVQAMPQGGRLRVSAASVLRVDDIGDPPGGNGWVEITFTDTGIGIAPKHLAKIFDPFFTTKATGTGFGLATTYSVIQQHNGHIRVESELGRGTTFRILLPALAPA
jgi:PAS domain S-box-containing protein